ncbi:hypothetical protein CCR97_19655 [Rhodoplanes elegans]|uniref:Tc1-like transposase DDE domain-containing protein n=1 Tax=Rhodoplanes elegans TaxID=29408 RepID=A0A327KPE7_9BRAD|nr:hypothetical protein [Rhodoplanes elegans]RAI40770.1 hypothetical protein CH338_05290 [Rhodoplanes elegans]
MHDGAVRLSVAISLATAPEDVLPKVLPPTPALKVPRNVTLLFLPSRSPEVDPVENVWQYLRGNWLFNRVFDTYDDIVDAACDAWRRLVAQPETITSIGMRAWGSRRSIMRAVGIILVQIGVGNVYIATDYK